MAHKPHRPYGGADKSHKPASKDGISKKPVRPQSVDDHTAKAKDVDDKAPAPHSDQSAPARSEDEGESSHDLTNQEGRGSHDPTNQEGEVTDETALRAALINAGYSDISGVQRNQDVWRCAATDGSGVTVALIVDPNGTIRPDDGATDPKLTISTVGP